MFFVRVLSRLIIHVTSYLFFRKNLGTDNRTKPGMLPKIGAGRLGSGRSSASSAKQHYLSKARYVPGQFSACVLHNVKSYVESR